MVLYAGAHITQPLLREAFDTTTAGAAAPCPAPVVAVIISLGLAAANDHPNPAADAGRSAQKYAGMAQDFRASAWEHLDKGDLPQASNKAWGLVAETVKAISTHHGGFIHTHNSIAEVVIELARLAGNAGDLENRRLINSFFVIARGLHSNYYENELHEDIVLDALMQCEELSQRLYALFWPEGAAAG